MPTKYKKSKECKHVEHAGMEIAWVKESCPKHEKIRLGCAVNIRWCEDCKHFEREGLNDQ